MAEEPNQPASNMCHLKWPNVQNFTFDKKTTQAAAYDTQGTFQPIFDNIDKVRVYTNSSWRVDK